MIEERIMDTWFSFSTLNTEILEENVYKEQWIFQKALSPNILIMLQRVTLKYPTNYTSNLNHSEFHCGCNDFLHTSVLKVSFSNRTWKKMQPTNYMYIYTTKGFNIYTTSKCSTACLWWKMANVKSDIYAIKLFTATVI